MLSIILGTRPEIIKMSPVINECEKQHIDFFILHTGQHYSYEMDKIFFEELELPGAQYNLDIGSGSHGEQTGKMLIGIERILTEEKPNTILVEGDTNTVLAGALAATKLGINVGHVEAGLRSFDRNMPEEINRALIDHVSDYLFAPTETAKQNLQKEGIAESKIFVTGNTIVDAVYRNSEIAKKKATIVEAPWLKKGDYFLVTAHRQENVDVKERLQGIVKGLELLYNEFSIPIIFPVHPRTHKKMKNFDVSLTGITPIDPVGFLDFLWLEGNATLVLTDSGGVQEEACILRVPCVTLRDTTERPETIEVGSNVLAGTNPIDIVKGAKLMLKKECNWRNPFGDGNAGKNVIEILKRESQSSTTSIL